MMLNNILPLLLLLGMAVAFGEPALTRISMVSLGVSDMARSVKFYGETLGLVMSGVPGDVAFFRVGDVVLLLNRPLGQVAGSGSGPLAGAVEVIFPVESVVAAHANLEKRGCRFLAGPREVTTGRWAATFTDPDGHRLTILGPR